MASSLNLPRQREHTGAGDLARLGRSAWRAFSMRLHRGRRGTARQHSSLAVFDVSELPELRHIFGAGAARHTVAVIQRALRRIDPIMGRISRTTATSFSVLLPGYDAETALAAVRDALGNTPAIESDWHGEEIMVVPDFLIRNSGDTAQAVEQLCEQMLGEIAGKQQSVRLHRDYLRRERESHLATTKPALL